MPSAKKYPISTEARQSAALEYPGRVDDIWVKGKTILITGGASGFGEGFARRWAAAGATIICGDINAVKGPKVVESIKEGTGNQNVHFVICDVTSWPSQVNLFKEAIKLSPSGGIDTVVANAGIVDSKGEYENPRGLDSDEPPPPNMDVIHVNLTGVAVTAHLAMYYLQKNPDSSPANPKCDPAATHRDRHLLLLGSIASLMPLPGQALYGASKHAVLGLYRCLRASAFTHGVRVNLICPYFIDTPLIGVAGRVLLAGGTMGTIEDVVEAGTRFTADPRIVGRAVVVGPKLKVEEVEEGGWTLAEGEKGEEKSVWEIYPHDFEDSDVFMRNVVSIMNRAVEIRGWKGYASDMFGALTYAVRAWWK